MIRKEIKENGGRTVFYLIEDSVNVSAIISELSSMGCKGDELGGAYKTLISDNKGYLYENKETKEKLLVIDERHTYFGFSNPFLCLFWMLATSKMWGNPYKDFIEELKKDGEVIK